jgi:hypothetical protein
MVVGLFSFVHVGGVTPYDLLYVPLASSQSAPVRIIVAGALSPAVTLTVNGALVLSVSSGNDVVPSVLKSHLSNILTFFPVTLKAV